MANEVTREQIEREINYRFPRDHHAPEYEHQRALTETADDILALFAPLREENAGLREDIWKEHVPVTGTQHDPANGLIHGFCARCRTEWPCRWAPESRLCCAGGVFEGRAHATGCPNSEVDRLRVQLASAERERDAARAALREILAVANSGPAHWRIAEICHSAFDGIQVVRQPEQVADLAVTECRHWSGDAACQRCIVSALTPTEVPHA